MRCFASDSFRELLRAIAGLLASFAIGAVHAGIEIRSAELNPTDDGYLLDADYKIDLNPTLEEALNKGVALFFELEFELTRPRWYWFDKKITGLKTQYKLSYNALTRQYGLIGAGAFHNFTTLQEALSALSRVREQRVLEKDVLDPATRYVAALRLQLDVSQLPKPFQLEALANRGWTLDSDWHRWTVPI